MDLEKYQQIILNLKIIGQIPRNGKIRRAGHGGITLEGESILTPAKRTILGDSRNQSVSDINGILQESFSLLKLLLNHKLVVAGDYKETDENRHLLQQIFTLFREFVNCLPGLENLRGTYRYDIKTASSILFVIDQIKLQIEDIKRKIVVPEIEVIPYKELMMSELTN